MGFYPTIADWTDYRLSRTSTTTQSSETARNFRLGLTAKAVALDADMEAIAGQIADISTAYGDVLNRLAVRWGVDIAGLATLADKRLIVAGARIARRSIGTLPDVCATWQAATGGEDVALFILGKGCLWLQATRATAPSAAYMAALEVVMRRAMPAGYGIHASIALDAVRDRYDTGLYATDDSDTGTSATARYAWSFSIARPEV